MVRPRGWHLEKHVLVDGRPMSGGLFDFGLFYHNTRIARQRQWAYFYLPKLENHREAWLWNDVFVLAQNKLTIPQGTIRATVLVRTFWHRLRWTKFFWELRHPPPASIAVAGIIF